MQVFDERELAWFVTNSYNLALRYYTEWKAELVVSLLDCCMSV